MSTPSQKPATRPLDPPEPIGDPFAGETDGIPNGLRIPNQNPISLIFPQGSYCDFASGGCGNPANNIAPNTGGKPDPRPLLQQLKALGPLIKHFICGANAKAALVEDIKLGATKGAGVGLVLGGLAGSMVPGGTVAGATAGAAHGALDGAALGAVSGVVAVGVCVATGAYN